MWGTTNGVPNMVEVHPDTVGQSTGQTDKHGVEEIYIGSQVEVTWDDGKKELYAIEWSDEWWGFCLDSGAKMPPSAQIEVIGTIHDNTDKKGDSDETD